MKNLAKMALAAACLLGASLSHAGLIQMYNTNLSGSALDSIAEAEAIIAASGGADFTTNANYINFSGDSFPGVDFGAPPLDRFVMRVTGTLNTDTWSRLLMNHDDGFVVRLNGGDFFSFNGNTAPRTTVSGALGALGVVSFELLFWDQGGAQVAQFGGTSVSNGKNYFAFIGDPVAVPEPGTLGLLGLGLLVLAFARRAKG
jgi:PEP-CTERM motif-containing protein